MELLDRTNGPIVTVLFSILMKTSILRGAVVAGLGQVLSSR